MNWSADPRPAGASNEGRASALRLEVPNNRTSEPLRTCVREAVENYFRQLDGHEVSEFFNFVMAEVEAPLLEAVLEHTNGNQSRAGALLGINRSTLRKKLKHYNLI